MNPKMLGLATSAVAMTLTLIGPTAALATTLTGSSGTLGKGTQITATASSTLTLKAGFANVTCTSSTIGGFVESGGSSTETVKGTIAVWEFNIWHVTVFTSGLTFSNCGSFNVQVLKEGGFELHTNSGTQNGNGTLTSFGAEITTALGSTSCTYGTPTATSIGTLIGSANNGSGTATLNVEAGLAKVAGGFLCANPAKWEGSYRVTNPDYLDVD